MCGYQSRGDEVYIITTGADMVAFLNDISQFSSLSPSLFLIIRLVQPRSTLSFLSLLLSLSLCLFLHQTCSPNIFCVHPVGAVGPVSGGSLCRA